MKFTTINKTVPVELDNNGTTEEYVLHEMTAAARDKYMDTLASRMRMGPDGKPTGVTKFEGMQADLIVASLRTKDGAAVRKDTVQSWPSSTVSGLFEEAQKLNLLNRDVQEVLEETKNA